MLPPKQILEPQLVDREQPRVADIKIENKTVTALWLILGTQIFYSFMYSFFIKISAGTATTSHDFVYIAFLLVLIIAGFGLILSYPFKLVWSSIGFNLFIAAFSIQTFFLVNAFWTKAAVYYYQSNFDTSYYYITLLPGQLTTVLATANLIQAIKCALSSIVAFSFIIGRAGFLQAYIVSVVGPIVYQLCRQICANNFPYELGTLKIFVFGGFFGLLTSFMLHRMSKQANTQNHFNYWTNRPTITISLLGTLIVWALFPLLTKDILIAQTATTFYSRVLSIVLSMSSAGLLAIFLGNFRYGFRMVSLSILGAGVATLSSSAYISNPVYAVVFGLSSCILQFIFCYIHQKYFQVFGQVDPNSYVFFGQGLFGIFFQTINRQIVQTNQNWLTFVWDNNSRRPEYILGNGAISIALGLILGFILGTLFSCCAYHQQIDHFTDFTYWKYGDDLQLPKKQQYLHVVKVPQYNLYVAQKHSALKEKNAYL